jgi:hypothetical protein
MVLRILSLSLVCVLLYSGGKKHPTGSASNEAVEISATAYCSKATVREVVGSDLGGYIVVVDVRVNPKSDRALAVYLDDFVLRSDKDGQRSEPFAPSQIAGRGTLVISERGGAGMMVDEAGPVWGGYPGTGRPRRMSGPGAVMGTPGESTSEVSVHSGSKEKENPLLVTLKEKCLPETETSEPVSGLLYFPMEGKHKPKQLEMYYQGPAGKLSLRFRR